MSEARSQADFAVIRQRITMLMLLNHFQITNLKREGSELRGPCPICKKGPRSFAVNTTKNQFYCHSCKAKGSVIDLVAKIEKCDARTAGLKVWEWFNLDEETISPTAPNPSEPRVESAPFTTRETQPQTVVHFTCPNQCGGELRKKMTFYLTSEPAFGVHGKCNQCGAWGNTEIPLDQLFKDAPIKSAVQ